MIDIKVRILEVLERGYLMSLGTADSGGVWVAPVIYIFDGSLTLYWMSSPDVRHSKAILENASLAASIALSNVGGEKNLGLQFAGKARKIDGPRYDLALKHFGKRDKPAPPESEDILKGRSWYELKPDFIELIDEENFGFKKQKITLSE